MSMTCWDASSGSMNGARVNWWCGYPTAVRRSSGAGRLTRQESESFIPRSSSSRATHGCGRYLSLRTHEDVDAGLLGTLAATASLVMVTSSELATVALTTASGIRALR